MSRPTSVGSSAKINQSVQEMNNQSFDDLLGVNVVETLEYSPAGNTADHELYRKVTGDLALVVDDTTTANVTYIGKAKIGEATSNAVWQVQKIDETSGVVITWADGNNGFDNVWDNRASLSYS